MSKPELIHHFCNEFNICYHFLECKDQCIRSVLASDLHFRLHWFRWLIEQPPDFDLVCKRHAEPHAIVD
jgi:hypothetical protein